jgi:acetolactate synthase-1/2/3 large subunit
LTWLIESEGPAFLEVVTDKKVPVLPMVPAGSALHEFLVYDGSMFLLSFFPLPSPFFLAHTNYLTAKDKERRKLMAERTGGKHGGNVDN